MSFPDFFSQIPPMTLHDPLAETLGAARGGLLEYRYADVVRLAGHSCPTVAGAWCMAREGLAALYPDTTPERGGIRVALRNPQDAGTTGVVGAVIGFLTGAAGEGGFKGLGGRHVRQNLLAFGAAMQGEIRLTRLDTGAAVELEYHPEKIPPAAAMAPLLARVVGGTADVTEREVFARLWQERVGRILLDSPAVPGLVVVQPVSAPGGI